VTRVAVIVIALVVLGWLGVMERAVRLQASAVEAAEQRDYARAEDDLRRARLLNPDTLADVRRAFVLQGSGRREAAAGMLDDVLQREPENLDAWGLLYAFTRERDPIAARRALRARRRLDPLASR
jgi:tetratricopeptide (TPR) repeat protein